MSSRANSLFIYAQQSTAHTASLFSQISLSIPLIVLDKSRSIVFTLKAYCGFVRMVRSKRDFRYGFSFCVWLTYALSNWCTERVVQNRRMLYRCEQIYKYRLYRCPSGVPPCTISKMCSRVGDTSLWCSVDLFLIQFVSDVLLLLTIRLDSRPKKKGKSC